MSEDQLIFLALITSVSSFILYSKYFIFCLKQAARDGKRELVERRLEKLGKGSKKINKRDQDNTTALHYAVRYNHLHIVKLLLEYGAGKKTKSLYQIN